MTMTELGAALRGTPIPFAEQAWNTAPEGTYGVYQVDFGGRSLYGDGSHEGQVIHGSVDVFVVPTDDWHLIRETVEDVLNGLDAVAWKFNSLQYEAGTKLTHLEWIWESVDV